MKLSGYLSFLLASLPAVFSVPPPAVDNKALSERAPSGTTKNVIIQMFEWSWDSVASECTNFIGPAGYGFVQGQRAMPPLHYCATNFFSEPSSGAYHWHPMVDRLPACIVHFDV